MSCTRPTKPSIIASVQDAVTWGNCVVPQLLGDENISLDTMITQEQAPLRIWFRGHGIKKNWELRPSIFRKPNSDVPANFKFNESSMCWHFKLLSHRYRDTHKTAFEWLTLMQHYGVPTRLLDWTDNLLIALYFAVEDAQFNSIAKKGELIALNARELNHWQEAEPIRPSTGHIQVPENLNVILRSELAFQPHLSAAFLQVAQSPIDGASHFGQHELLYALSDLAFILTEDDIKAVEQIFPDDNAFKQCLEKFLIRDDDEGRRVDKLLERISQVLPPWIKNRTHESAKEWIFRFLVSLRYPVAVFPYRNNGRLIAQSGMFTISGGKYLPVPDKRRAGSCQAPKPMDLEEIEKQTSNYLYPFRRVRLIERIPIKATAKKHILNQLLTLGIHGGNIYPEVDKQASYLKSIWMTASEP